MGGGGRATDAKGAPCRGKSGTRFRGGLPREMVKSVRFCGVAAGKLVMRREMVDVLRSKTVSHGFVILLFSILDVSNKYVIRESFVVANRHLDRYILKLRKRKGAFMNYWFICLSALLEEVCVFALPIK